MIEIYTDGACSGNQFKNNVGAYAYIILIDEIDHIIKKAQHELNTTNNRMEMLAVITALQKFKIVAIQVKKSPIEIVLYSDSQYVISTINENWKRKKNVDLWNQIDELIQTFKQYGWSLSFEKVKGHSNNHYNNLVDKLAVNEITKYKGA